jgi:hypothetical protein
MRQQQDSKSFVIRLAFLYLALYHIHNVSFVLIPVYIPRGHVGVAMTYLTEIVSSWAWHYRIRHLTTYARIYLGLSSVCMIGHGYIVMLYHDSSGPGYAVFLLASVSAGWAASVLTLIQGYVVKDQEDVSIANTWFYSIYPVSILSGPALFLLGFNSFSSFHVASLACLICLWSIDLSASFMLSTDGSICLQHLSSLTSSPPRHSQSLALYILMFAHGIAESFFWNILPWWLSDEDPVLWMTLSFGIGCILSSQWLGYLFRYGDLSPPVLLFSAMLQVLILMYMYFHLSALPVLWIIGQFSAFIDMSINHVCTLKTQDYSVYIMFHYLGSLAVNVAAAVLTQ